MRRDEESNLEREKERETKSEKKIKKENRFQKNVLFVSFSQKQVT